MVVETYVPAKINLWLEVVRKREDGYHELSSLMLPVSIFDRIAVEVSEAAGPVSLRCNTTGIPEDSRNLAWRAAERFLEAGGLTRAVHIDLEKNIPSGAGLGGGSSDAAGVLLALNHCFQNILPAASLHKIALGLGADVPFFLHQKPALATGIGEKLEFADGIPEYPLLLIKPPVSVPTAWVYSNLKLTRGKSQITLGRFNTVSRKPAEVIENDLESVTTSQYPVISDLKKWLLGRGALASSMSGSGPTVFGIFESRDAALAAEIDAGRDWPNFWAGSAKVIIKDEKNIRMISSS